MTETAAQDVTQLSPSRLIDLLTGQRDLFASLIELAGRQRELIETGQTDELLSLLGRRGELVSRLQSLAAHVEPYRRRWEPFLAARPEGQRQTIGRLLDQLRDHQRTIAAIDARDSDLLRQGQKQLRVEAGQIQQASGALRAYAARAAGSRGTNRQA
jgi:hypothetical protein